MSTRKPLHYYLENTDRLTEISLDSLKEWSLQYPYAENIKILLAKKCEQLGLRDDMEPYYRATASTNDRRRLYEVLQDVNIYVVPDAVDDSSMHEPPIDKVEDDADLEDVIASLPQSDIEVLGIENSAIAVNGNGKHHSNEILVSEPQVTKKESDQSKSKKKYKKNKLKEGSPKNKNKEIKKAKKKKLKKVNKNQDKSKNPDKKAKKKSSKKANKKHALITSEPNSPYTRWLLELREQYDDSEPYRDLNEGTVGKIKKKKKRKKKSKKASKAHELANKSIKKQEDIVSEPLAAILVAQGHLEEAKEMYSKLSLIFPEKNSFFAAEIEKIKQKLEL